MPTHNRNDLLRRTLASLAECRLPLTYIRTIVMENGGRFGADVVVREAAAALRCQYCYCETGNKSAALNMVLEYVGDELLVFFDDDVRLSPAVLESYAAAALDKERCFFGGPCGVDYEEPPAEWLRPYLPPSAKGLAFAESVLEVDRPLFLGFNWAARAADLRAMGGFNSNFGPGSKTFSTGQEAFMQRALLAAGFRGVVVPNALVWHYVPRDRCSQDWALLRNQQGGISQGLRAGSGGTARRGRYAGLLGGSITWTARLIKALALGDEQGAFHAKWRLARIKGEGRGLRQARKLRRQEESARSLARGGHSDAGRPALLGSQNKQPL